MIVTNDRKSNTNESVLRIVRQFRVFKKRTLALRVLSFATFCFFFLLLPYLYFLQRGTPSFFISIAFGYILMFTAALLQFQIRRRLLPKNKTGLITHTLYTALLPWHAMRCADQLSMDYSRHWRWPAILACFAESPGARKSLLRLWRESLCSAGSIYSKDLLKPILEKIGLNTDISDLSLIHI